MIGTIGDYARFSQMLLNGGTLEGRRYLKAETVALIRSSGKSVPQVCRDLDPAESVVRRWLAQADIDDGRREGTIQITLSEPRGSS